MNTNYCSALATYGMYSDSREQADVQSSRRCAKRTFVIALDTKKIPLRISFTSV